MITIKIDEETAAEMLLERLAQWTEDKTTTKLYKKMYENYIFGGCFDGVDFDVMEIVDNDFVNYCRVIDESDGAEFDEIKKLYAENGCGDISCDCDFASYIEAVDDENEPTAFLIRC